MLYHDFHPHHCSLCRLVRENPAIVTHCMARPGGKRNETTSAVRRRLCNRRILESNETETPTSTVSPLRRSPTLCHCIAQAVASRIDRSESCCPIVGETEKSCGGKGQSLQGEKSHDPKLPQPRGALGSWTVSPPAGTNVKSSGKPNQLKGTVPIPPSMPRRCRIATS
jgi:hypothetical protein